ncbi:MAG TPA: hypothetical protein VJ464_02535 [Blastocatellia bacterium]|nr:hypothetical protein [Blastocatellia bacterium]
MTNILVGMLPRRVFHLFGCGLLLLIMVAGFGGEAKGQCLQGAANVSRIMKTTGDPRLDTLLNQEGNLIYSVFGVNPNMFLFDDGEAPNAFASPTSTLNGYTGTVYLGTGLLRTELWSMNKGGFAVAGVMAHEFAHILQIAMQSRLPGKLRELHADFMAGYYLARKSYIAPTNIRAFAQSLFEKGDYDFWSPSHHGTPQERVGAMLAGYRSGNLAVRDAYYTGERWLTGR